MADGLQLINGIFMSWQETLLLKLKTISYMELH